MIVCERCNQLIWAQACDCRGFRVRHAGPDAGAVEIVHARRPEDAARVFLRAAEPSEDPARLLMLIIDDEPYEVQVTFPPLYQAERVTRVAPDRVRGE